MRSKKAVSQIAHALLMVVILVIALYFSRGTITGQFVKDLKRNPADIFVDKSQSYVLSLSSDMPLVLKSLRLSGEVSGGGSARIYLDNGAGVRRLVYSNSFINSQQDFSAAEFVARDQAENEALVLTKYRDLEVGTVLESTAAALTGPFRSFCSETCELDPAIFNSPRYELSFFVDPGTSVKVSEVLYTKEN